MRPISRLSASLAPACILLNLKTGKVLGEEED